MSNNLLTEVSRISEIIYGTSQSLLNEGVIGNVFKNIAEAEIQKIIRAEIKNAIRAGAKDANAAAKNSAKNIESSVLKRTGLGTLTGPQRSALRTEAATIAKQESAAAAKKTAKTATSTGVRGGTVVSKGSSQNVNKMVQNLTINLGNDVKAAIKGPVSKTVKTAKGGTKRLKTAKKMTEAEVKAIDNVIVTGGKEQLEQGLKSGWTWKRAVKWATGIGLGIGALWLLIYFMSSEGVPVPTDTPDDKENTGDGNTGGGNTGGGNTGGSSFKNCEGRDFQTYGCKSSYIKRVQKCLGLVADGMWGPKTNQRLSDLGYAAGFDNVDVDLICSKAAQTPTPTPTAKTTGEFERGKEGTLDMGGDASSTNQGGTPSPNTNQGGTQISTSADSMD